MAISVRHFGNRQPAEGVEPLRIETNPRLPFGKKNPIDWTTGKHMPLRKPEEDDDGSSSSNTDEKVKGSATDAAAGFLDAKVAKSIVVDSDALQLDGDATTPGNNKLYGTNVSGSKGWLDGHKVMADSDDATPGYLDAKVAKSVVVVAVDDVIELDGDVAAPGNFKVYGTNGSGTKGFQDGNKVLADSSDTTPGYLDAKVAKSIVISAGDQIELDGDEAAPGNSKVYGTTDAGVKGWGDAPGGAADNPGASITTIGAATEGSETASSDTWTAGTANGLAEWYVSREVYNDAGDEILYSFLRKRTYDKYGRLYSVSGETRVTVETPEEP